MTFSRCPSSTVSSTSSGRCGRSAKDCGARMEGEGGVKLPQLSGDGGRQRTPCPTAPPPVAPYLEGHELVVGFGGPGVDLHRALQRDHQELDPLVLHCGRQGPPSGPCPQRPQGGQQPQPPSPLPRELLLLPAGQRTPWCPLQTSSSSSPAPAHPHGSGGSPPGPPRWSSLASSPLPGRCAKSCCAARRGNRPAACSSFLQRQGRGEGGEGVMELPQGRLGGSKGPKGRGRPRGPPPPAAPNLRWWSAGSDPPGRPSAGSAGG